jgi:hypothetical protein
VFPFLSRWPCSCIMIVVTATPPLTQYGLLLNFELILIRAFGISRNFRAPACCTTASRICQLGFIHKVCRWAIKRLLSLPKQSCQTISGSELCSRDCFTLVNDQRGKPALKYAPKDFWYHVGREPLSSLGQQGEQARKSLSGIVFPRE